MSEYFLPSSDEIHSEPVGLNFDVTVSLVISHTVIESRSDWNCRGINNR